MSKPKIEKLFENNSILVFNKPAGLSVHGDTHSKEYTLADFILEKYKKLKDVGENIVANFKGQSVIIPKPGIVHRLDKDTSGAIIVAKNKASYQNLKAQFQNHEVKKEYLALVWGNVRFETGIINSAISRSKNDFRKKEVVRVTSPEREKFRGEARDALTRYKVVDRISLFGESLTLVSFFPETGRTHQIRIHSKSIGHPIVGDHLYGPEKKSFEANFFKKNPVRQLLHAKSITFTDPETGESLKVESPLPKEFRDLQKLKTGK